MYHIFKQKIKQDCFSQWYVGIGNVYWAPNQHNIIISEGSYVIEDWSNGVKSIKKENGYFQL